jgi:hypothetical protein
MILHSKDFWFNYIKNGVSTFDELSIMKFVSNTIKTKPAEELSGILQAEAELIVFVNKTQRAFEQIFHDIF